MPSPFPGMDPFLENPGIFPDFHDSFITYLRENLQANLPPPYYAALGRRIWIEASRRSIEPDVHILRSGTEAESGPELTRQCCRRCHWHRIAPRRGPRSAR